MSTVRMTNYSLDRYEYKDLVKVLAYYNFKKVVLIGGKKALDASESLIRDALENSEINILGSFIYGKDSTLDNVYKLRDKKEVQDADIIFAIGGGKAIDNCKVLGKIIDKKVFSFPTISSNCSAATALAVIYNNEGPFYATTQKLPLPYICLLT